MYVFAFDRDWTVDVNPHPRQTAVPLEWVRYLAHETEHAVYAIGNQDLAAEAAIPGVVDIVGRHEDDWDDWLGAKQPEGRYERFPSRRERLSLVRDLHPEADEYVVVDDIDLRDVDDWTHYHAWEFVPAVERGDLDPTLPWADAESAATIDADPDARTDGDGRPNAEAVADSEDETENDDSPGGNVASRDDDDSASASCAGGVPSADVTDPDASELADFLAAHEDAPGFELATTASVDGEAPPSVLADASMDGHSMRRPAAAPVLRCEPVDPRVEPFRVRVDEIDALAVTNPPVDAFLPGGLSGRAEARGLRRLAGSKPETVPVLRAVARLDESTDRDAIDDVLRSLRDVAAVAPAECTHAVPAVRAELERDEPVASHTALTVIRHVAVEDPGAVAPAAEVVIPYLEHDREAVRTEAAHVVSRLAHHDLDDVRGAIDALAAIIRDDEDGLSHAVYAMTAVSRDDPRRLVPIREPLAALITDADRSAIVRSNAIAALGRLVAEEPRYGEGLVDHVAALFDASDAKLRNNAVAFLADVATVHSGLVEPHLDALTELATAGDDLTRVNATGAIARLAEDHPDAITTGIPGLVKRLTDDNPLVRKNACEILGYAGPPHLEPALDARASHDDDPDVRSRAAWARDQLTDRLRDERSEVST